MAQWAHSDVLDNGIAYIKANANKMMLISNYASNASYATVVGNKIAEVTMASGDYALSGAAGAARVLTTASGKSAATTATSTPVDSHIAFVDTTGSKVLYVTDETTNQAITSGNTVNFPVLTYTSNQPTI